MKKTYSLDDSLGFCSLPFDVRGKMLEKVDEDYYRILGTDEIRYEDFVDDDGEILPVLVNATMSRLNAICRLEGGELYTYETTKEKMLGWLAYVRDFARDKD